MVGPPGAVKSTPRVPSLSNTPLSVFQSGEPPVHVPTSTLQGSIAVGGDVGIVVTVVPCWGLIVDVGVLPGSLFPEAVLPDGVGMVEIIIAAIINTAATAAYIVPEARFLIKNS